MPDVLTGSPYQVIRAFEDVLSVTYLDNGATQTSLEHAIDELNTLLTSAGEAARLDNPVTIETVQSLDNLTNPEDCPAIRIVSGDSFQGQWAEYGDQDHGTGRYDIHIMSYLSSRTPESGETTETSCALLWPLWVQALVRAFRRRSNGIYAHANSTIINCQLVRATPYVYATNDKHEAEAVKLFTVWRVTHDAFY